MPSGDDPIGRPPTGADAAHAMQTVTRYEQQDGTSEPVKEGRFGRDARLGDHIDEARANKLSDPTDEPLVDYVVDPQAVAAAIVERLLAGRTLGPLPQRD